MYFCLHIYTIPDSVHVYSLHQGPVYKIYGPDYIF